MMACVMQGSVLSAFCEEEAPEIAAQAAPETAEESAAPAVVFSDEAPIKHVRIAKFPFLDTSTVAFTWGFPYSDRFFDIPSNEFSITMAQGSLGIALSAFRSTANTVDPQYETYFKRAGFTNLRAFGYDEPTTEDSLSGVIAMRKVNGSTVIAVVTCGQGYQNEWAGNLRVGTGERHEGFSKAATLLESYLDEYISDYKITGSKKLWVNGISRAGAVGNIVAADAIESGEYDDVYAYLYGVPRTTKKPVAYPGIYNICGQYDPVSSVPLQSWGYERYGTDLYTPAQESDARFPVFASDADRVAEKLENKSFRNNPELNYQLHLIMEFIGTVFEDNEEYAERFQDLMIEAMNHHSNKAEILSILKEAFDALEPEDRQEKVSIKILIDYLSFIAGQHLRADQRQIRDGNWLLDEPLAANLVLEHRPATYVHWLFADTDPEKLLTCSTESRRIAVVGKANVGVINKKGASARGQHGVFMMRNGQETIVSLPGDGDYSLIISAYGKELISYYEVPVTPARLLPGDVTIRTGQISSGTIRMESDAGQPLSDPEEINGNYLSLGYTQYNYDPTVIMNEELNATRNSHLTVSGAVKFLIRAIMGLVTLLLICLVMFLVHRYKVKRGHPPYPDTTVIIPHLVIIAALTALTEYSYFFLFYIPKVRGYFAATAVFVVFLLTIRGIIRSRELIDLIAAGIMLALTYPIGYYFYRTSLDQFSWIKAAGFVVIVVLMCVVAIWTFHMRGEAIRNRIKRHKEGRGTGAAQKGNNS